MSLPTLTLSFYHVAYEPVPPVLCGSSLRPVSAEEVTASCELLLATAQRHGCAYWLLDGRHHEREQPQALHDWMQEEYFPRVRATLGRLPCVAFMVQPFVWAGLIAKGYDQPQDWQTPNVRMGWFTDEAAARAWLNRLRDLETI